MTTCPFPSGTSTAAARLARPAPSASVPESSMSSGFAGNCSTTRGAATAPSPPAPPLPPPPRPTASSTTSATASAASRYRGNVGGARRLIPIFLSGVFTHIKRRNVYGHSVRRYILSFAAVNFSRRAPSTSPTASASPATSAAHSQHWVLIEIYRQVGAVKAVRDRTLLIREPCPQN